MHRLNLHLCAARHPFSSSFAAFWRHPKLSWGVSLMWKGFSNAAISMFIWKSIFISRIARLCAPISGLGRGAMAINERKLARGWLLTDAGRRCYRNQICLCFPQKHKFVRIITLHSSTVYLETHATVCGLYVGGHCSEGVLLLLL